jgi:hypothetical protein
MSTRPSAVLGLCLGLVLANAPAAFAQPSLQQVQAVTRCQDTINREGRALVRREMETVEACGVAKLTPLLKLENGLITAERFDTDDARANLTCTRLFTGVAAASKRFVDAVIRACGPVESLIMDDVSDPLGLVFAWGPITVEELAGSLCTINVIDADFLAEINAPRGTELAFTDPNILIADLDPRCF